MKIDVCVVFWSVLFETSFLISTVEPGGSILLQLNALKNPRNQNYKGSCCSGAGLGCKPCDYQLEIWVNCDGRRSNTGCFYGHSKTGIFPRTSNIAFSRTLGNGLPNPLIYNFSIFTGTLGFQILATDRSGTKIDDYIHHVPFYPESYPKMKWKNIILKAKGRSDSSLDLKYSVSCNEHYHGPSCMSCIPGWFGPKCDCRTTPRNSCDVGTGKKICYSPWYGDNCDVQCVPTRSRRYSCDKRTGRKICRSGWYGNECDQRTPVISSISTSSFTAFTAHKITSATPSMRKEFPSATVSISQKGRRNLKQSPHIGSSRAPTSRKPDHCPLCIRPSRFTTSSVAASNPVTSKIIDTVTRTDMPLQGISPTFLVTQKITSVRAAAVSPTSSFPSDGLYLLKSSSERTTSSSKPEVMGTNHTSPRRTSYTITQTPFPKSSTGPTANTEDHKEDLHILPRITKPSISAARRTSPVSEPHSVIHKLFPKNSNAHPTGTTEDHEDIDILPRITKPNVNAAHHISPESKPYSATQTAFLRTPFKSLTDTSVNMGKDNDFETRLQITKSSTVSHHRSESKHYVSHTIVMNTSNERTNDTFKNIGDHEVKLDIPPKTIKPKVTVMYHIPPDSKPYDGTETSLLKNVVRHTEKLESIRVSTTNKSTLMLALQTSRANKRNNEIQAAILEATMHKRGSSVAARKQETWSLVLLLLMALLVVTVTLVVLFKKRQRKRRKVTPQHDIALKDVKQQELRNVSPSEVPIDDNYLHTSLPSCGRKISRVSI